MTESLNKRISWLGLADFDYLSARILLLCGLGNTGLVKAAEAFEKIFKLFLMLEAKITENKELNEKDLKIYGHNIEKLFAAVKSKIPVSFDKKWDDYFKMFEDCYSRRYPEHWKEHIININLRDLDEAYTYFRNGVIFNFPDEEKARAKDFGTFLYGPYNADVKNWIKTQGGKTPSEILTLNNLSFDVLDINKERL
jgi:hypothetical protein